MGDSDVEVYDFMMEELMQKQNISEAEIKKMREEEK